MRKTWRNGWIKCHNCNGEGTITNVYPIEGIPAEQWRRENVVCTACSGEKGAWLTNHAPNTAPTGQVTPAPSSQVSEADNLAPSK